MADILRRALWLLSAALGWSSASLDPRSQSGRNAGITKSDYVVVVARQSHFVDAHHTHRSGRGCAFVRFSEEYEGKRYGLAMWTLRGSAYKSAKQIFTSMRSVLRNGLVAGKWECASRYVSKDTKQSWYEPNMRLLGLHNAKFTEWAKKIKEGIATTPSAE